MALILIVSPYYPRRDQASGDLRLFTLLTLLTRKHRVHFCALDDNGSFLPSNEYSALLESSGVQIERARFSDTLNNLKPDLIWFEFYYQARQDYLNLIRRRIPSCRILIDSVDVHFKRLLSQAAITGKATDFTTARNIKDQELRAYSQADLVVAVTKEDAELISPHLPNTEVAVVPNVHESHPYFDATHRKLGLLIFVGGFAHAPNVDAMLYFCNEVFPLVEKRFPEVRLKIIGSNPPPEILSLASPVIEVLGFVPDTTSHFQEAYVSIAPLRFGGGMKGKVGEAMSWGLPVVTTSFGSEGFGLVANEDALIGDTAEQFANHVLSLIKNPELHSKIGRNGHTFITKNYGIDAVSHKLHACIDRALLTKPQKQPMVRRAAGLLRDLYDHHVAWRLR